MGFLTLENILQAQDLEAVEIEVPEWGGSVQVRPLTAGEKESIVNQAKGDSYEIARRMLAASLIAPKLTLEQVNSLWAQKNSAAMERLITGVAGVNGLNLDEKAREASFRPE